MVNNFISLHCLSRKELDTLIEHELQLMLAECFDKPPISAKALHIRLKAKGIVNGGLSTLSSLERKRLIAAYVDHQLGPLNLRPKEKQQYVNFLLTSSFSRLAGSTGRLHSWFLHT